MPHVLDARGLRCPLPYLRARLALQTLGAQESLVVFADDPEAAIDLAALAVDAGRVFTAGGERFTLGPLQPPSSESNPPTVRGSVP